MACLLPAPLHRNTLPPGAVSADIIKQGKITVSDEQKPMVWRSLLCIKNLDRLADCCRILFRSNSENDKISHCGNGNNLQHYQFLFGSFDVLFCYKNQRRSHDSNRYLSTRCPDHKQEYRIAYSVIYFPRCQRLIIEITAS